MTVDHILVATDGSSNAARAVRWAADLAGQTAAQVTAVHVFEPLAHLLGPGPFDLADLRRQAAVDLADTWCSALKSAGVDHLTMVVEGKPAEAIAAAAIAAGADLIVVGARGLAPLGRVVLGSTSARLPSMTTIPVAIIQEPRDPG